MYRVMIVHWPIANFSSVLISQALNRSIIIILMIIFFLLCMEFCHLELELSGSNKGHEVTAVALNTCSDHYALVDCVRNYGRHSC